MGNPPSKKRLLCSDCAEQLRQVLRRCMEKRGYAENVEAEDRYIRLVNRGAGFLKATEAAMAMYRPVPRETGTENSHLTDKSEPQGEDPE